MTKKLNQILFALLPASVVAAIAIPMALIERGRWGVGGEWLLVVLTFIGVFFMEVRHDNDK